MPGRLAKVGSVCSAAHAVLTEWGLAASCVPRIGRILFELLANAIQHGAPPIHVILDQGFTGAVSIAVGDAGAGTPHLVHTETAHAPEQLRGLAAVDALAQGWDVQQLLNGGKTVTAVFVPTARSTAVRAAPGSAKREAPTSGRRAPRTNRAGERD
jgi:anti-sigma regulatory factor (Ser/Thr protein kinase)